MYLIFAILILIASVLLIGVVLIQKSKGGGLAANVNNYNQFMGVRKTTDFIEKATWSLAALVAVLSIASAFVVDSSMVKAAPQVQDKPATETQAPSFPTAQGEDKGQAQQGGEAQAQPAAQPAQEKPAEK